MVFNMVATLLRIVPECWHQPTCSRSSAAEPEWRCDGRIVCASIEAEVGPSARTQEGALLERWLAQCGVRAPLYSIALNGVVRPTNAPRPLVRADCAQRVDARRAPS